MTAAKQSDTHEPDWVRTHREHDYLVPVADDNARDPEYTSARIRHILDTVLGIGADVRSSYEADEIPGAEDAQRRAIAQYLPKYLEGFLDELRSHGRTADVVFDQLSATFSQLRWSRVRSGFLGLTRWNADSDTAAEKCATALGLSDVDRTREGQRDWRGEHDGWSIRVVGARPAEAVTR